MLALVRLRFDVSDLPADDGFLHKVEIWDKQQRLDVSKYNSDILSIIARDLFCTDRLSLTDRTICENTIISNVSIYGIMAVYLDVNMEWCKTNMSTLFILTLKYIESIKTIYRMMDMTMESTLREPSIFNDYRICADNEKYDCDTRSAALIRMMLSYVRYNAPVNKLCAMCEELSVHGFNLLIHEINGASYGKPDTDTTSNSISGNTRRSVSKCFGRSEDVHQTSGDDD